MKKRYITQKKERVVLSDVLPYELPATFSNRHFYEFLLKYEINIEGNKIKWKRDDYALKEIIKLIFDLNNSSLIEHESIDEIEIKNRDIFKAFKTVPFGYKISHNEKDFRELTVIHPKNQLSLINFYDQFKELIIYYSNINPFSLRRPYKIAKFTYYKDKTHLDDYAHDHEYSTIEEFDKEYKNLKTYFTYKEISNIYKFYESYKYHRCEKKYDKLFTFDISKCFDSIYTHSISWALLNKDIVKDNISSSKNTFGGQFDRIMQDLNYGETNGIVIGPEFSRIYAELILQQIDRTVKRALQKQSAPYIYRRDYEIYRYVDDYFIFYNDDRCLEEIMKTYRLQLKEYNLYVNDSKSEVYGKPIITDITRAKLRIVELLDKKLSFIVDGDNGAEKETEKRYSFYISSNRLITQFKTIIKESGIDYTNIQNYTLACIERKTRKIIHIYGNIEDKKDYESKVSKSIIEILDFAFFLYSVSPKVNSTIKLCLLLSKVIKFSKINGNFNQDNKHLVYKKIYDEIFLVLKKYESKEHTQVETLYLLITLRELGRKYRIDEELLCKHYGINLKKRKCENHLNYHSIIVLLFYIENVNRYKKTKSIIKKYIIEKYSSVKSDKRTKYTELILLLFDLLVCPYIDRDFKNKLLTLHNVPTRIGKIRTDIINKRKYWFTKWSEFDFTKELEAKKSKEVY